MELGALVCTARAPRCPACPLLDRCAWVLAGRPALDAPVRRPQSWAGSDRQVRGRLLGVLRDSPGPVGGRPARAGVGRAGAAGPGPRRAGRRRAGRPAAGRDVRPAGVTRGELVPGVDSAADLVPGVNSAPAGRRRTRPRSWSRGSTAPADWSRGQHSGPGRTAAYAAPRCWSRGSTGPTDLVPGVNSPHPERAAAVRRPAELVPGVNSARGPGPGGQRPAAGPGPGVNGPDPGGLPPAQPGGRVWIPTSVRATPARRRSDVPLIRPRPDPAGQTARPLRSPGSTAHAGWCRGA